MRKLVSIIFIILFIFGGIFFGKYLLTASQQKSANASILSAQQQSNPKNVVTSVSKEKEQMISFSVPKRLVIDKIGVDTQVESVGMDSQKQMGVPKNANNVAWFNLGYIPGSNGNAVIAGHYDKVDGSPAVFWDLSKLVKGDKVSLFDEKGNKLIFVVTRQAKYPYDNFPLQEVFGSASQPRLNFITCQGEWSASAKNYSHRSVVYTTLLSEKE
jgi:sortase A